MRYLFLAYEDEHYLNALSTVERDAFESACRANDEALRRSGYLIAVEDLQSSATAATVRVQNGEVFLSSGPYTETKERLMQLFFIRAGDLNEAIRVASNMPQARGGPIEVRPAAALDRQ